MTNRIENLKKNLEDADLLRNELRWIEPCKITNNPFVFWIDDEGDMRIATLKEIVNNDTSSHIGGHHLKSLSDFLLKVLGESADKTV
jgi:hypothetical protein